MRKKKINRVLIAAILCLFSLPKSLYAQDSLKIFCVGYFKNEVFKFYHDSLITLVKTDNKRGNLGMPTGFSIYIDIPKEIQEGQLLNFKIERKSQYGLLFKNTEIYIEFRSDMKYLVIVRLYRNKNRYPFYSYWTCQPPLIISNEEFWSLGPTEWDTGLILKNENDHFDVRSIR